MIELICGTRILTITPYEREINSDGDDWVNIWIEFSIPELQTKFNTTFTVYEMIQLRSGIKNIYQNILSESEEFTVTFESLETRINFSMKKIHRQYVEVNLVLRPENHAESIQVTDTFYLDQSYFPALLLGLDKIIFWQN